MVLWYVVLCKALHFDMVLNPIPVEYLMTITSRAFEMTVCYVTVFLSHFQ